MWDIVLNIGHSVRETQDCVAQARADITILTNIMEARVLRGPEQLMQQVRELTSPEHMWPSRDFFRAKLTEQETRHTKCSDTEYNLEPNVKSSPGGLRDLQVIGWIAERHFGVESLEKITAEEFLTPEEMDILITGRDFMWQVRYALHMITNREEDRLLFDHQRELAALWGLKDGDKLAVEQFMQVYYRWALALGQLNELLIQNFDQAILRQTKPDDVQVLNERFQIRNGYIEACRNDLFATHPPALLEVFLLCATHEEIAVLRLLRVVDVAGDVFEGVGVDHSAHEVRIVSNITDFDLLDLSLEALCELLPHALGYVHARGGRTLLTGVPERRSDHSSSPRIGCRSHSIATTNGRQALAVSSAHYCQSCKRARGPGSAGPARPTAQLT